MLNEVNLMGYLGAGPDLRYMPSGEMTTTISLATNRFWTDQNTGEKRQDTEWHRIVLYGRKAEIAAEFLKKGSRCHIQGYLKTRSWVDRTGEEHYITEVMARRLILL